MMKKIMLLLILQFTALMAITYNVTDEGQMIPVTPTTEATSTTTEATSTTTEATSTTTEATSTTGSAKTNWGFQGFTVPPYSVTVQPGGDIQAAINSLTNGGTVYLEAGDYYGHSIELRANIVIQGAGRDVTTLHFDGTSTSGHLIRGYTTAVYNIILRDFTADCEGVGNDYNGIEFYRGVSNVLVENLEVKNAGRSNIISYNNSKSEVARNLTFRNIISRNTKQYHGIAIRYAEGVIVENCQAYNLGSQGVNGAYGFDMARSRWIEVANCYASGCEAGGAKFPGSNYYYVHDLVVEDNNLVGIMVERKLDSEGYGRQYAQFENVTINHSKSGMVDWGDIYIAPTFQEIILKGVTLTNNTYNNVRIRGAVACHEYDGNIGLAQSRVTGSGDTTVNNVPHTGTTPEQDKVGYTTWPTSD